jgi:hypothetical protein
VTGVRQACGARSISGLVAIWENAHVTEVQPLNHEAPRERHYKLTQMMKQWDLVRHTDAVHPSRTVPCQEG